MAKVRGLKGYTKLRWKAFNAKKPELSLVADLCSLDAFFSDWIKGDLTVDHALKLCMNELTWKDNALEALR
jgi:hypothetical protein